MQHQKKYNKSSSDNQNSAQTLEDMLIDPDPKEKQKKISCS